MKLLTFVLALLIGALTILSAPITDLEVRGGEYGKETEIVLVDVYVETETEILYLAKCGGSGKCHHKVSPVA